MGGYVRKKRDMVFQSVDSLQQIVNVVNEAAAAVNDSKRTIKESAIPEVLAGALGAGIGGVTSNHYSLPALRLASGQGINKGMWPWQLDLLCKRRILKVPVYTSKGELCP